MDLFVNENGEHPPSGPANPEVGWPLLIELGVFQAREGGRDWFLALD
jgi:hypothetical protein